MMYRQNAFVPVVQRTPLVQRFWTRVKCRLNIHKAGSFNWVQSSYFGLIHIKFFCKHCGANVVRDLSDHRRNIAALHCGKGITW